MKNNFLIIVSIFMGILLGSCSSDDGPATAPVEINILNLEALEGSLQYKAWLKVDGNDIAIGTFQDVNFPKSFTALSDDLTSATEFFITIEGVGSSDNPSDSKIASATFSGTSNTAQISSSQTLGDFTGITGSFVLRTFTGDTPTEDANGVWFTSSLSGSATNAVAGLSLPIPGSGWEYEGWVVLEDRDGSDVEVSIGKFSDINEGDSSDIFSGNGTAPSLPGEDFLNEAAGNLINVEIPANLVGKEVYITLQPTSSSITSEPFYITLLSVSSAIENGENTMNSNNFFITGTVER
ncbi:anti-sigma factor [Aquimarina pacifica]|uniref:anti-sigma factor n=1 Tax=Aquimarina pacifica TaxID=1296415 RepID=UPI0004700001|nr:anti-sigma factor [Aquimarina pacifica]